jgi:hypothetical protein
MSSITKAIKSFLFSNMNKQFFIFLFFVLLSAVFWLILTLNETYEKEVKVPVRIVNIPKNVVLTSAAVDTVRATVRDKGWVLISYLYGEKRPALTINYKNYDRGNGGGIVSQSELKRFVEQKMESSTKVTSIKPERLEFFYNNGEYKRVPVRWTGRVMPEQLYFISNTVYSDDSVDVYASHEKLDSIRFVETEPLNCVGFRDTLEISCKLMHASDVKVVPDHIKITFHTDVLTEESINVTVKCLNLPPGKLLRTFPTKVRVNFVAGVGQFKSLREEDFSVVADYLEIEQNPSERCNIYLRNVPQGISRATLSTKQIDYLIEDIEE